MIETQFVGAIRSVAASEWNALADPGYPFLRHEFLAALEDSGSVGGDSGWQAHHLLLRDKGRLLAAMPCYLKSHSYGEYVFDWSWADAYARHQLRYYPKLLSAIPFTPASGPRLLIAEHAERGTVIARIVEEMRKQLSQHGISSWHLLFPQHELASDFTAAGLSLRNGVQFHWHNRGYRDFEDFLDGFVSRKRKSVRRERRQVAEQGLQLRTLRGSEIDAAMWDRFHVFYQMTYARRSGHGGYLNRDFFHRLGQTMPESLLLVVAESGAEVVAGALNVVGGDTLYGRYWGCTEEFAHLHFETCYYQGIDFCIREGLARFDAGAQGEHKLARGFEPVLTHSCHLIAHPAFATAIDDFLQRERPAIEAYQREAQAELPFRQTD
jgi:uncharacterized protein